MMYQFKTFKNVLLFFGFLVFISSSALSQGTTSLWKVTSEGSDRTIYLGGSIHILGEDDHPLPSAFELAYRASDESVSYTHLTLPTKA